MSELHEKYFTDRASTATEMTALGIVSVGSRAEWETIRDRFPEGWKNWNRWPAFLIPWTSPSGVTEWQIRPDEPGQDRNGRTVKFKTLSGSAPGLWAARVVPGSTKSLVLEGVGKVAVALRYAPADVSLYGIAGVRMWQGDGGVPIGDLTALEGQDVVIAFDGDARTNRDVFDAGMDFRATLTAVGAKSVSFLQLPGASGKDGVDDYLAGFPGDKRADILGRLIDTSGTKPAKARPSGRGQKVPEGREPLDVTNPADAADWLSGAIGTGGLAGYFGRDDRLVFLPVEGDQGYDRLTDQDGDQDGPAQVRAAGPENVAARISLDYWCYVDNGDDGKRHALFSGEAARTITNAVDRLPNLRKLRGVTHTPMVRRDGSILDTPGYDEATGLYFLPFPGLEVPSVPGEPTSTQVKEAVELLDELTADFPFRTPDHRANFYGLLLTPVLRQLVPPPYKLGVFDAPMSRSGKTLMTDLIRAVHGGVFRTEVPKDNEEWVKTIGAILQVTTAPVVTFDNVSGRLQSSALDGLLSSRTFQSRQLGSSKEMIDRANDRLWTITSNNANLSGDLVPRSVWVSINPAQPNPETRTGFRHADILGWTESHRGEILAALLTLVRAWVVAGRPAPAVPVANDKWDAWVGTVRSILSYAGMPGTFDARESKRQTITEENEEWATFLEALSEVFGDREFTATDIVAKIAGMGRQGNLISPESLPGDLGTRHNRQENIGKSLGRWLTNHDERYAGGRMVECVRKRTGTKVWAIRGFEGLVGLVQPELQAKTTFSKSVPVEKVSGTPQTEGKETQQTLKPTPALVPSFPTADFPEMPELFN